MWPLHPTVNWIHFLLNKIRLTIPYKSPRPSNSVLSIPASSIAFLGTELRFHTSHMLDGQLHRQTQQFFGTAALKYVLRTWSNPPLISKLWVDNSTKATIWYKHVHRYRHPLLHYNRWTLWKPCFEIKILRFSREWSLFVLFQSIVRLNLLIEAKKLYSWHNF